MISDSSILSFRVGGVPVDISMTALFLVAFLALSYGRSGTAGLVMGLAYAVLLIFSILVHELGHALVGARLGLRPQRIVLHGFGGYCEYGRRPTATQGVISSLAGPFAGLLLGGVLVAVQLGLGSTLPPHVQTLLGMGIFINIFWSVFNLLPMYPLDGGHVLLYALRLKLTPLKADRIVKRVTIPLAIAVGIAGYLAGFIFIPLICFFAVLQVLRV